jgi:hypothetical protein
MMLAMPIASGFEPSIALHRLGHRVALGRPFIHREQQIRHQGRHALTIEPLITLELGALVGSHNNKD